jgi:hypothetical protein
MRRAFSRPQFRSEHGIALPLTLGVMLTLTISVTAMLEFSSANARSSSLSVSRQNVASIAEDGFNRALSVIAANPTNAGPVTGSAAGYPYGGSVTWTGAKNGNVWTVSATATARNPTGPDASPVSKTVAAELDMTEDVGAWNFVYVKPISGTCLYFQNAFRMESPLYVDGDLCLKNESVYAGPRLYVKGKIQTENFATVGTPAAAIPTVSVKDNTPAPSGCRYTTSGSFVVPCTTSPRVYANVFNTTVPDVTKPPVDLAARYAEAAPNSTARNHRCYAASKSQLQAMNSKIGDYWSASYAGAGFSGASNRLDDNTSRDSGIGVVDLLPPYAYDCRLHNADGTELGRVAWTPGVPGTLTVSGIMFFDGDITPSSSTRAVVEGEGVIYANNKIVIQNNTWLCGVADCGDSWNPNSEPKHVLFLIAGYSGVPAIEIKSDAKLQGGLYAVGGLKVSNGAMVHGPAIANELDAENLADFNPWPWFVDLPDGAPSDGAALTTLTLRRGSWRN